MRHRKIIELRNLILIIKLDLKIQKKNLKILLKIKNNLNLCPIVEFKIKKNKIN